MAALHVADMLPDDVSELSDSESEGGPLVSLMVSGQKVFKDISLIERKLQNMLGLYGLIGKQHNYSIQSVTGCGRSAHQNLTTMMSSLEDRCCI